MCRSKRATQGVRQTRVKGSMARERAAVQSGQACSRAHALVHGLLFIDTALERQSFDIKQYENSF